MEGDIAKQCNVQLLHLQVDVDPVPVYLWLVNL